MEDGCSAAFPSVTPVCAGAIGIGVLQDAHQIPSMNRYSRREKRYVEYGSSFSSARRFGFGDPPSNRFAAQLDHHALDHAARHGWSSRQTRRTRITLRVLQARHRIQAPPVSASQLLELRAYGLPTRLALTMLADHGLLLQDRPPPLHAWFARLSEGGTDIDPLQRRPWGASDGQVTDRFGVRWLIGYED